MDKKSNKTKLFGGVICFKQLPLLCILLISIINVSAQQVLHNSCNNTSSKFIWSTTPSGNNNFDWNDGDLTKTLTNVDGSGVNITYTFSGETNSLSQWSGSSSTTDSPAVGLDADPGGILQFFTSGFSNNGVTITITFSTPVEFVGFDLFHVNGNGTNGDKFTITATDNLSNTIYPTFTSSATPSYTANNNTGVIDSNTNASVTGNNAKVGVNFSDSNKITSITILWEDCNICSLGNIHGSGITGLTFCEDLTNPNNYDSDNDGIIDSIDIDDDNDGILDAIESGVYAPNGDEDGDGTPNYLDTTDDGNSGDSSTTNYTDTNSDGIPDVYDNDGDGVPNHLDLDSDNDGIPDNIEAQSTSGYIAPSGTDSDNDGLDNAYDTTPNGNANGAGSIGINPINTDSNATVGSDTVPDYLDLDSDGDGVYDIVESGSGLTDTAGGADGKTDGIVGNNGLDNTLDNGDDYTDVNGSFDNSQTDNFTDTDGDVNTNNGDVDYRDITNDLITNSPQYLHSSCENIASSFLWSSTPSGNNLFDWNDGDLTKTLTNVDGSGLNITYTFTGETNVLSQWSGSSTTTDSPAVGLDTNPEDMLQFFTSGFSSNGVTITITFSTPVEAVGFDLVHVNGNGTNGDKFTITATNSLNNTIYPTFTSSATPSYTVDNNTGVVDSNTNASTAGDNANVGVNFYDSEKISSITILWQDCDICTAGNVHGSGITGLTFCKDILDSDNDGTPDSIDIDDDNDGILDAIESGIYAPNGDEDGDGVPNYKDPIDNGNNGDSSNTDYTDSNSDGIPDVYDNDVDGVPNHLDLDSDNDGIPDNIEAQSTSGYIAPSGIDSDNDGLDNAYDTTPNGNANGAGSIGITPVNTDNNATVGSDAVPDYLDLDSDGDGIYDIVESGSGLTDIAGGADGKTDGIVGNNGLDNTLDNGDDYSDVNGSFDNTQTDNFTDSDGDANFNNGDVDYRDITDNGTPMITQVYQFNDERWIEITNISTTSSIPANQINVQMYINKTGGQTGISPDATFTIPVVLDAGQSFLFTKATNTITNINSSAWIIGFEQFTGSIEGANDIITLSNTNDNTSWENRYDVIHTIKDKTSCVRIDEALAPNPNYTSDEWVVFIDDALNPYQLLGNGGVERHPHDPLISEIINSNSKANTRLGLHRVNITTRTGNAWNNGYPDRSRFVVVNEDYNHVSNRLSARKLTINNNSKLAISNNLLVVTNDITLTNSNDEIRLVGTSQLVQTHKQTTKVSGNGKLLVDQNSSIPSLYRYNYMSSPVNTIGTNTFTIENIFKDGTSPLNATTNVGTLAKNITFISGYDGSTTNPISLADYWVYTYSPSSDGRSNWTHKYKDGQISESDGFIFKGPGVAQNYTFLGTPKDGNISASNLGANESYLVGNPFSSALSVKKFIEDNINSTTATLYFWQHVGEEDTNSSITVGHNYAGYIGGYATRNIAMGLSANSPTLVSGFDLELEAENATIQGTISSNLGETVVDINNPTDFIEFKDIIKGVDALKINYKSNVDKSIILNINGVNHGTYTLPTSSTYTTFNITICIEAGSDVRINSNDSNSALINHLQLQDSDGNISCAPSSGGTNASLVPQAYIPIGQGFFIQGDSDGGPIVFNNSQREFQIEGAGNSVFFKGKKHQNKTSTLSIIKLGIDFINSEGNSIHRQLGASFNSNNSFNYDKGYDSEIYDIGLTDVYWKLPNDELKYVIVGVQEITEDLEVPFEIIMDYTGSLAIQIDEIKEINNNVYLKDKLTNQTHILNKENAVAIQLQKGIYKNRFSLVFKNSVLSVDDDENQFLNKNLSIFFDNNTNELVIKNHHRIKFNKVNLYNIIGQKIKQWNNVENVQENRFKIKNLSSTIYIVNIQTDKGKVSKKIIKEK